MSLAVEAPARKLMGLCESQDSTSRREILLAEIHVKSQAVNVTDSRR